MSIVLFLLIGALAGWLAGQIMKGGGFGLIGNIIVGVLGAVIGGLFLGKMINLGSALVNELITAVLGAVILLFVIGLIKK